MTHMQKVESSVREHDALALPARLFGMGGQLIERKDLLARRVARARVKPFSQTPARLSTQHLDASSML